MCEGVLSHRRQSAPLTVLMPNEVLSPPSHPPLSRTCGICVTFQYPVAWFLFSYFLWRFSRCVCVRLLREKSQVTNQNARHCLAFAFWFHSVCFCFRMFFLLASLRLGLWAVYLGGLARGLPPYICVYPHLSGLVVQIESHASSQ